MDVWARKQDMNTKRAIHVLAGMNDRLYAIGGNHLKGEYSRFSENLYILNTVKEMLQAMLTFITLRESLLHFIIQGATYKKNEQTAE